LLKAPVTNRPPNARRGLGRRLLLSLAHPVDTSACPRQSARGATGPREVGHSWGRLGTGRNGPKWDKLVRIGPRSAGKTRRCEHPARGAARRPTFEDFLR